VAESEYGGLFHRQRLSLLISGVLDWRCGQALVVAGKRW